PGGAGYDLVAPEENGLIFPCGDVDALAGIFRRILPARERLRAMGEAARTRMATWSPRENIDALVRAVEFASKAQAASNGKGASGKANVLAPKIAGDLRVPRK